ncbi:hypothetical protein JZ751_005706 [Albula glossodonta]|uniref:Uncharacterized protein n=1 Tax=Albula glossodonta TaxID=121402 RepID=A0A8T2N489_9TELE|nr:hypothetical protein JZ751_005706 [Albula glossodonta]
MRDAGLRRSVGRNGSSGGSFGLDQRDSIFIGFRVKREAARHEAQANTKPALSIDYTTGGCVKTHRKGPPSRSVPQRILSPPIFTTNN